MKVKGAKLTQQSLEDYAYLWVIKIIVTTGREQKILWKYRWRNDST